MAYHGENGQTEGGRQSDRRTPHTEAQYNLENTDRVDICSITKSPPSADCYLASSSVSDVAKAVAYLDTGDNASVELKNRGITLAIYKGGHVVGTVFVTKTGIRWLPKGGRWSRKSKKVVGKLVSWSQLDDIAHGKSKIVP